MNSFTIVCRPDDHSKHLAKQIETRLKEKGIEKNEQHPELCIVVGGDGTFLYAIQQYMDQLEVLSFLGIHTGTLGFFSSYCEEEIDQCLEQIEKGISKVQQVDLLEVEIEGDQEIRYALNDMRIENSSRTQKMELFLVDKKFETYHGTGLCLSTQLGSTAYNRSVQGAVIYEGLSTIQLSEIAGIHHHKYRSLGSSLVLPKEIEIRIESDDFEGALLCMDSQCLPLKGKQTIRCRISQRKVKMAYYKESTYLERLRGLFL